LNRSSRLWQPGADLVWQPTRQHLIQHDTERINVAAGIQFQRIGQDLFRTHVCEGSNDLSQVGLMGDSGVTIRRSRDTEVENLGLPGLIHKNVARLKVAVDDSALMRVVNGVADFGNEVQPLPGVQLMRTGVLEQGLTTDELHGEIRLRTESIFSNASFINLRDAGMLQPSQRK
jgi:hypothetical protein